LLLPPLNDFRSQNATQCCSVGVADDVEEGQGVENDLRQAEHHDPHAESGEQTA